MFNSTETTIRPGLLVSLKTTISGNVRYEKRTIEPENVRDGKGHAIWETEKHVANAAEYDAAKKARADARNAISAVCAHSSFGLICPENNRDKLNEACAKAQSIIDAFNVTATCSHIAVYVLTGRIAADDSEAIKALKAEVRDLLDDMHQGIASRDVKMIRDACNKARALSVMLTDDPKAALEASIEVSRDAARLLVKAGDYGSQGQEAIEIVKETKEYFA